MTTVNYTMESLHGRTIITWADLGNGDDGTPYQPLDGYDLESIQYTGTIGTNPALKIQGSNQETPTVYGELATSSAIGVLVPSGQTRHFRPAVVGGSGTTVTAIAYFQARG